MSTNHFAERAVDFIPALILCDEKVLDDPRVQKQAGVPTYLVDVDGVEYRVTEVPENMYADGQAGWAVFDTDGHWLGDKVLSREDRVAAQWVYPTAIQAVNMVLIKPAWVS